MEATVGTEQRVDRRKLTASGLSQLTLVEHALCPLDTRSSLVKNLVFDTQFQFTNAQRQTQTANASVICPLGLCSGDEFLMWGLLALTFQQPEITNSLVSTPHYVLRQLGLIDQHARRGGRQYRQFAEAIERISLVKYRSDLFYDPIRREHRKVSFGFLSYSLPLDPESHRAWRIAWDPIFFELTQPKGGHFWFDLATYRGLDSASRRLFLFLCKIYSRRATTPKMTLRHLGENILGFSRSLVTRDLKVKVTRCVERLTEEEIIDARNEWIVKRGPGDYRITLTRGSYFARSQKQRRSVESPLSDLLRSIGLEESTIERLLRQYKVGLLQEWADITLAARERHGPHFFKRSPAAFFIDNVKHAAKGQRTPPDWWHELRKQEFEVLGRKHSKTGDCSNARDPDRGIYEVLDHIGAAIRKNAKSQRLTPMEHPSPAKSSPKRTPARNQRNSTPKLERIESILSRLSNSK